MVYHTSYQPSHRSPLFSEVKRSVLSELATINRKQEKQKNVGLLSLKYLTSLDIDAIAKRGIALAKEIESI